jgi:NAD-dependent deacetylase
VLLPHVSAREPLKLSVMSQIEQVAQWLCSAEHAVGFTGAGISTESGIPDFRSPGGIWSRSQPVYFDDFLRSAEARQEYWRQKAIAHQDIAASEPNVAHRCLARWQAAGLLHELITQNIDGLHEAAGSSHVILLHGTARQVSCLDCSARYDADPLVHEFRETGAVPGCPACITGRLKHATISFGQALDQDTLTAAAEASQRADLMLVLGSSLVVQPAASLPRLVQQSGGRLVIINRESTALDAAADCVIHQPIGQTLAAIDAAVQSSP